MLIHLSRESVAAGDDVESHDQDVEVDSRRSLVLVIADITGDGYLPLIQGGRATWLVRTNRGGRVLAVVAQNWDRWDRAALVIEPSIEVSEVGETLHFEYLAQLDATGVLDKLRSS